MVIRAGFWAVAILAGALAADAALAQDVKAWPRQEAESILTDEVDEDIPSPAAQPPSQPQLQSPASQDCPRLPNGQCAMVAGGERGFKFSPMGRQGLSPTPSSRPPATRLQPSRPRNPAAGGGQAALARPAQAARPREVPLQFGLNSTELSPQSQANLQTLASVLNDPANRGKRILITGHTDKSGNPEANRLLSERRADAVAIFLAQQGVEGARIESQGLGFDSPLPDVSPFDRRNRRVEIKRVK